MNSIYVLFGFVLLLKGSLSDFHSAVDDMMPLIKTEESILQSLKRYVTEMDEKLKKLKWHLDNFEKEHEKASQNLEEYVFNPINAFTLIKRLTLNWNDIQSEMTRNPGRELVKNISSAELEFPDDDDLSGAADALVRLQETYNLSARDISKGILNGVQFDSRLTADDCFELGKQSYEIEDYYQAVKWMTAANMIYAKEIYKTVSKPKILEYLSYSLYMENDLTKALQFTNELLDIEPNHEAAQKNKTVLEEALQNPQFNRFETYHYYRGIYDQLCNNEVTVDESIKSQLKCRYVDYERPFLKLAKLKEEEVYPSPKMLLYHDVLYDKEIEVIKTLMKPNMKRAMVHDEGKDKLSSFRVSKVGWLGTEEHPYVPVLNQRIEDITGLTTTTAEQFQVLNYGIGGYYAEHTDWILTEKIRTEGGFPLPYYFEHFGDRIGTILFYMSDVRQGGATVFPHLKVSIWPKKGTAVFWPNLYLNGSGNRLMSHAACPVISGSKWVINKWIHEIGQEFRKPCGLLRDEV